MASKKRTYLIITKPGAPWTSTELWIRATTYEQARSEAVLYFDDGDLDEEDWECYVLPRETWYQRMAQEESDPRIGRSLFLRAGSCGTYAPDNLPRGGEEQFQEAMSFLG